MDLSAHRPRPSRPPAAPRRRAPVGGATPTGYLLLLLAPLAALSACGAPPLPEPPAQLAVFTAGTQDGYVGEAVQRLPAVRLLRDGKPVASVAVDFTVSGGGGSATTTANSVTGADGVARVGRWVLGDEPGPNTLTATALGASVTFRATGVRRVRPSWGWRFLGAPLGDGRVERLAFDPADDRVWYVTSPEHGLYLSRDAGATWTHALRGSGLDRNGLAFDAARGVVWAALAEQLHRSADQGRTWQPVHTFSEPIRSLLLSPRTGALLVAMQTSPDALPTLHLSEDDGGTFQPFPLGLPEGTQALVWQLAEDPLSGALYAGVELADHPAPYAPPFLRSLDGGRSWEAVTGLIPWHVLSIGVDPRDGTVFAMTEGSGIFRSADRGARWTALGRPFGHDILLSPTEPDRLFGAEFAFGIWTGGVYASQDRGDSWQFVGLPNRFVSTLALAPGGHQLYAVAFGEGLWVADVPPPGP